MYRPGMEVIYKWVYPQPLSSLMKHASEGDRENARLTLPERRKTVIPFGPHNISPI